MKDEKWAFGVRISAAGALHAPQVPFMRLCRSSCERSEFFMQRSCFSLDGQVFDPAEAVDLDNGDQAFEDLVTFQASEDNHGRRLKVKSCQSG